MSWIPLVVMPNVEILCKVDAEHAAIVGPRDERWKVLQAKHLMLKRFLAKFCDEFKIKHPPSMVLLKEGSPETYRQGRAVASLRDLLAMSTIPYKRAQLLAQEIRGGGGPFFADSFDFYPWMLDRNYERIVLMSPALHNVHGITKFVGQSSPGVPRSQLSHLDQPLLDSLIERWERRYATDKPLWSDTALFRSLNMAYHAARMPFSTAGSYYDQGRLVALWVSAFEILAHTGTKVRVTENHVLEILRGQKSRAPRQEPLERPDKKLRTAIYRQLYDARNDYLHGNPVGDDRLSLPDSNYDLTQFAAPLYRIMLTEFLELHHTVNFVPRTEPGWDIKTGEAIAHWMDLTGYQKEIEKGLRTFKKAKQEDAVG
ncbi:hypothetical protein [Reyranella sp.]|uniref:hypothetical protein n=1 Tax=Reyranella sp. TaxID=1929291 RepID=UPI004036D2C4